MIARTLPVVAGVTFMLVARVPAGEGTPPVRDVRLSKAVTLDDYHPWTPITDPAAWKERAQRVREQILVAAGLWPMPPRPPIKNAVIHGAIDRGDYTVEKVYFESYPGFYVTGNLYRPRAPAQGLRPAVLCPHGHWQNGRLFERPDDLAKKEIEKGAEKTMAGAKYPLQARCAQLARMGCVVFFYDMVGNADSKQIGHGQGFKDVDAELRLQSAFGLQTFDSIRALDFLSSLDGVDPKRIAVTGASGGGTQTFILCAVDDRPAVAFPAVMVSTVMQGGCVCENATLLRVGTGNIEIAALTAPRPLGMTGANDWTIDIETKGLPELKALYAALGSPDNVYAKCYPHFDHNYNQVSREEMYRWVNRHLKLGFAEPIDEKPFDPIPPDQLRVFDDTHKLPANAVDSSTALRKEMTETSEKQMADLLPKDAASLKAYHEVVGKALRAIVSSELPKPAELEVREVASQASSASAPPFTATRLLLGRKGSGEAVPAVWVEPKSWNRTVVVLLSRKGTSDVADIAGDRVKLVSSTEMVLSQGAGVLGVDLFLTGSQVPAGGDSEFPIDAGRHKEFCGYTYGYNRTPLANQVHDALTAIGHARAKEGVKRVLLIGGDGMGHVAILASALAGDAVTKTYATRPGFDFSEVKSLNETIFLPGGVKYGGLGGFAALIAPRELVLVRGKSQFPAVLTAAYKSAGAEANLRQPDAQNEKEAISDLLR